MNFQDAQTRAAATYYRAKADFERLDALSRQRALTEQESRLLENAINRMTVWGAAA
jgi:hypothetical protein